MVYSCGGMKKNAFVKKGKFLVIQGETGSELMPFFQTYKPLLRFNHFRTKARKEHVPNE